MGRGEKLGCDSLVCQLIGVTRKTGYLQSLERGQN